MKQVNFNDFKKLGMTLIIEDKEYNLQSIPYPIEKDIYQNLNKLQDLLNDITKINEEWEGKIENWIWSILSYKKNNNEITKNIVDDIDLTERIAIMVLIIGFITRRMTEMKNIFGTAEKKTEIPEIMK
jgi:hypothetical protein